MIEIKTDAIIFYGKKSSRHCTGKSESEYLEIAEEMAKTKEVTRVRIKAQTYDDKKPMGCTISWYGMNNGKPEIIYSEMK